MVAHDVLSLFMDTVRHEKETMPYVGNFTPRRMPSRRSIWVHWKPKVGTPSEKVCFLCEYNAGEHNLDRAHMVARCCGGADDVENLLLLCGLCHRITEYFLPRHWHQIMTGRGWT